MTLRIVLMLNLFHYFLVILRMDRVTLDVLAKESPDDEALEEKDGDEDAEEPVLAVKVLFLKV